MSDHSGFTLTVGTHQFTLARRPQLNLGTTPHISLLEFTPNSTVGSLDTAVIEYADSSDMYRKTQIWAAEEMLLPELGKVPTHAFMSMMSILAQECVDWLWEIKQRGHVENPTGYPTLMSMTKDATTEEDVYRYLSTYRKYTKVLMNLMFSGET